MESVEGKTIFDREFVISRKLLGSHFQSAFFGYWFISVCAQLESTQQRHLLTLNSANNSYVESSMAIICLWEQVQSVDCSEAPENCSSSLRCQICAHEYSSRRANGAQQCEPLIYSPSPVRPNDRAMVMVMEETGAAEWIDTKKY